MDSDFLKALVRGLLQVATYAAGTYLGLYVYERHMASLGATSDATAQSYVLQ